MMPALRRLGGALNNSTIYIAVIGSSTAAGQGAAPPEKAWVNLYRAYLKSLNPANEVFNLGLGGQQTFQLLPTGYQPPPKRPVPDPERNVTKALSLRPDAIIVNAPSNDAMAFYGPEEQIVNFDLIIQTAKMAGVPVWICTTQPRVFSAQQIDIQLRLKAAILSRYGEQAINVWDILATPEHLPDPRFCLGDGAHLNNQGHQLLFEQVRAKNLPAAIAEWQCRHKKQQTLASGSVLNIPPLMKETAYIEIYDDRARLRCRTKGELPMTIQKNFGPAGLYWVRVAGAKYNRLLAWVKTGGPFILLLFSFPIF